MSTPFPTLQSVQLGLCFGEGQTPAPLDLMQVLQGVEVTQTDEAPCRFQLTFYVEASAGGFGSNVIQNPLLQPGTRVLISAVVNGTSQLLIDGFITGQQLLPSESSCGSSFGVLGEDLSVKMDLIQLPLEYPEMPDGLIAASVLARYAILGILPRVIPTLGDIIPFGNVPQQNATDREYLKQLAQQNGNIFYIQPGPVPGFATAYWGPPDYNGPPQQTLNVNFGPFTNVLSMQFGYATLDAFFVVGLVMERRVDPYLPIPIFSVGSSRLPQLAANEVLTPQHLINFENRVDLWQDQGMTPEKSLATAQAMTDLSSDAAVTVQGELDVAIYGAVLTAPGVVGVRGAGGSYDGLYYVKEVQHHIGVKTGAWSYRQSFTLTRQGLGSTVSQF